MISKAVELHLLLGIRVGSSDFMVSEVQYVEDTVIHVDATIDSILTLKGILRGIELTIGILVNFSESSLIMVNSDQTFLDLSCEFFHYKMESLPFKYLGLPVGANPFLAVTWKPLTNILSTMLLSWKHSYVSLGGRVILLNSVLNFIPIFFLSLLTMSAKVWKKMVKIQRRFLCGGVKGESKISCLKWVDVCKPKKLKGIGVRDLRLVNLALLDNWRWHLLLGVSRIWRDILTTIYGVALTTSIMGRRVSCLPWTSTQ